MFGIQDDSPLEKLHEVFRNHGVLGRKDDDWLQLPRGCRVRVTENDSLDDERMQLGVEVFLWTGATVHETFVSTASHRDDRRAQVWAGFAASTASVIAGAFLSIKDAQVERATWQIGDLSRPVTLGHPYLRGKAPALGPWQDALRASVERSGLPRGSHWIRLTCAHRPGEPVACEVFVDNDLWGPVTEAMQAFPWPTGPEPYDVHVFAAVQGGLDLGRVLPMFIDHPRMSEDDFAELLGTRGVPAYDARLVVALVPLAFGRVMVARLNLDFAPTVVLASRERGERHSIPVETHPIFVEATRLAERARRRNTLTREQYMLIALRSPEIRTLNQALEAGASSQDLVWSQPIFMIP